MKQLLTLIFTLSISSLFAQIQIDSSFTLSGTADIYYRANLNSTNDASNGGTLAPGTSFANTPGFSLGMFNLIGAYEKGKVGVTADLVFGPRGTEAVFGSLPSQNIINQLFVYWNVTDKVKLTLGNFNTFLGYEVISPASNFNYSTSYMFSYGPFSHTGFKADFDFGGGFSGMAGVFNPTDFTDFNPTNDQVVGAQFGYTNDKGGAWLNFIYSEDFYQFDLTTGWQATDKLYLGLNATTAKDAFYGAALYLQVATSDAFSLGIRGEYFSDEGIDVVGVGESVFDVTLSVQYKVGNLTIIPEFRLDAFSNDDMVIKDAFSGEMQSNLASLLLAAVYSF